MLLCSFKIKEKNKQKVDYIALNKEIKCKKNGLSYNYNNIFEILKCFCIENEGNYNDKKRQKLFCIKKNSFKIYENDTYYCCSFIIKSGNYGIEADMTNINTNVVSYHKSKEEADMKDFICLIYVPKDIELEAKKGIIVFESIGSYGVKVISCEMLKQFFSERNITLEIKSISPDAFIEKLISKGKIRNITFITNNKSNNVADNILSVSGKEKRTILNPIFTNEGIRKLTGWINKKISNNNMKMCEIVDDENIEDITLNFRLGERSRTVRLATLDKISIVEDIPKNVETDKQIISYMIETADSYKEYLICN